MWPSSEDPAPNGIIGVSCRAQVRTTVTQSSTLSGNTTASGGAGGWKDESVPWRRRMSSPVWTRSAPSASRSSSMQLAWIVVMWRGSSRQTPPPVPARDLDPRAHARRSAWSGSRRRGSGGRGGRCPRRSSSGSMETTLPRRLTWSYHCSPAKTVSATRGSLRRCSSRARELVHVHEDPPVLPEVPGGDGVRPAVGPQRPDDRRVRPREERGQVVGDRRLGHRVLPTRGATAARARGAHAGSYPRTPSGTSRAPAGAARPGRRSRPARPA